jgi:hypothetical protein
MLDIVICRKTFGCFIFQFALIYAEFGPSGLCDIECLEQPLNVVLFARLEKQFQTPLSFSDSYLPGSEGRDALVDDII